MEIWIFFHKGQSPSKQSRFKDLSQGHNSYVDLNMATSGHEPPTFQLPVMYLNQ